MGEWRGAVRQTMLGEPIPLRATGGKCSFRPKKMSNAALDEIAEIQRSIYRDGRGGVIKKYASLVEKLQTTERELEEKREKGEEIVETDELRVMRDQAFEMLQEMPAMPTDIKTRIQRVMLKHGVGWHDFEGSDGKVICEGSKFDDATVEEVLEWGPLADEMCDGIRAHNRPLAKKSDSNSTT